MEGMDFLQGIKDAEGEGPAPPGGEDFALPSLEQMLEALEKLDLSDEDKESLRETLMSRSKLGEGMAENFFKPALDILPTENPLMTYVLVMAFLVMMTMFVFFGYKLYRSLTEKERKRDEKRKQKQMKKKK